MREHRLKLNQIALRGHVFVVRRSSVHGFGVFATGALAAGTRVLEYTGERITHAEAAARYDDERADLTHTLLFTVDRATVIDGGVAGGPARYVNHSCDPNCEARFEGSRIWIWTARDVAAGAELSYDYEYDWEPGMTLADLAEYRCRCGAPGCRGTMVDVPQSQLALARTLLARPEPRSELSA